MANKETANNCWEYWDCPKDVKEKCPAYTTNSGKECWMLTIHFTTQETNCPKTTHKYKYCWECPWYKKMNPEK